MKITTKRLRQIIAEEIIKEQKEELASEVAVSETKEPEEVSTKSFERISFNENMQQIIQEEYYIYMIEEVYYKDNSLLKERLTTAEAEDVIRDPRYSPSEKSAAEMDIETNKRLGEPQRASKEPRAPMVTNPMKRTIKDIDDLAKMWKGYLDRGGSLRSALEQTKRTTEAGEVDVIGALAALLGTLQQAKKDEERALHSS